MVNGDQKAHEFWGNDYTEMGDEIMKLTAEEQLAIFKVIIQADQLATNRNAKEYAELFTTDGKISGIKGAVTRQANLISFTQKTWEQEPAHSQHLTVAPMIMDVTAGTVTAQSTLLIIDPETKTIVDCQSIQHELQLQKGQWRFYSRQVL